MTISSIVPLAQFGGNRHHGPAIGSNGRAAGPPHTGDDVDLGARLAPRRSRDGPHAGAVVPVLPAECAVRRTRSPVQVERSGGVLREAQRQSVGGRVSRSGWPMASVKQ